MIDSKKRVDAKQNQNKIIKEVLTNPLQSQREIAKATWLGKTTVQEHLKGLPNATKDDRIAWLLDKDLELLQLIQNEKIKRMWEWKVNDNDIDKWENTWNKRRVMFGEESKDSKVQFIIS